MTQALGPKRAAEQWNEDLERVVSAFVRFVVEESKTPTLDEFEGTVEKTVGFVGDSETELGARGEISGPELAGALTGADAEAGARASREKRRAHDTKIVARVVIRSKSHPSIVDREV